MPHSASPAEILVVDDERISRAILVRSLQNSGFTCRQSGDGTEALRLIEEKIPSLVLMDYAMPGLNGAEVCQRLRSHENTDIAQLPVIMLTGMGGEEQEVFCLQAGASDFVTKPINTAVLKARIDTQVRLSNLRLQLETRNQELADWRNDLERDLEAARLTQQTIIPTRLPALHGWDLAAHYEPVIQVGGDIYDWLRLPDGRSFFWIADATGHGASAALLTALAKLLFRHAAADHSSPASVLATVNADFHATFKGRSMMTAMCIALEPRTGQLTVAGAGHPPLLLVRRGGGVDTIASQCPPLGLLPQMAATEDTGTLADGDGFLLVTDGFYDVIYADGTRMDFDSFERCVGEVPAVNGAGRAGNFLESLVGRLRVLADGKAFTDDLAALSAFRLA